MERLEPVNVWPLFDSHSVERERERERERGVRYVTKGRPVGSQSAEIAVMFGTFA